MPTTNDQCPTQQNVSFDAPRGAPPAPHHRPSNLQPRHRLPVHPLLPFLLIITSRTSDTRIKYRQRIHQGTVRPVQSSRSMRDHHAHLYYHCQNLRFMLGSHPVRHVFLYKSPSSQSTPRDTTSHTHRRPGAPAGNHARAWPALPPSTLR